MTISEGEFFGEEDIINNRNRTFGVFCSSSGGVLLMIKKTVFKMRICQEATSYNYLLKRLEIKENYRSDR